MAKQKSNRHFSICGFQQRECYGNVAPREEMRVIGVDGWLALFCFILIIVGPLVNLVNTGSEFELMSSSDVGELKTVMILRYIVRALVSFYGIWVGVSLWKRLPNAERRGIHYLNRRLAFMAFLSFILMAYLEGNDQLLANTLQKSTMIEVLCEFGFFVVWGQYMRRSLRVKNTYSNFI